MPDASGQNGSRERMRELAGPLRDELKKIDREIATLKSQMTALRADRSDVQRVLKLLDTSPANRQTVKVDGGAAARAAERDRRIRDYLDANAAELAEGFTCTDLARRLTQVGPAISPEKVRTVVRDLHSQGVLRVDKVIRGGAPLYVIVGKVGSHAQT